MLGRQRALSPVNPGDEATRQGVYPEGPPTRPCWEAYDQVALQGRKASSTGNLKPQLSILSAVLCLPVLCIRPACAVYKAPHGHVVSAFFLPFQRCFDVGTWACPDKRQPQFAIEARPALLYNARCQELSCSQHLLLLPALPPLLQPISSAPRPQQRFQRF